MGRKISKIDELAQKLLESYHHNLSPGEYEYVSTSAKLVSEQISAFYQAAGLQPPTEKTVRNWFYKNRCPDWAIAIITHCLISLNRETA
jgi:phage gp37-like protein